MAVDLGLDAGEDLFPDVALVHKLRRCLAQPPVFRRLPDFRPRVPRKQRVLRYAGRPKSLTLQGPDAFRLRRMSAFSGVRAEASPARARFPHIFPQLWKTLGLDRTQAALWREPEREGD